MNVMRLNQLKEYEDNLQDNFQTWNTTNIQKFQASERVQKSIYSDDKASISTFDNSSSDVKSIKSN